jgi:hypothetical protein
VSRKMNKRSATRIDDELVNHDLMERPGAESAVSPALYNSQSAPPRTSTHHSGVSIARRMITLKQLLPIEW